jgi:uncharacterized protein YbjQ (UPF0145 family)
MIKLNKFIILLLLFVNQTLFAKVEGKFCIRNIDKLVSIVKSQEPLENPLIAWDFDDTLFSNDKFRQGENTRSAISSLNSLNAKQMILTARLQGKSAELSEEVKEALKTSLTQMKESIKLFGNNTAIQYDVALDYEYPGSSEHMIVTGPAVFAGTGFSSGSHKAEALKILIDNKTITPPPSHVFMIDDTTRQLTPFEDVFADSTITVYLIHYPTKSYDCAQGFQEVN